MSSYDVIVIGVGGWGSSALYHLARRGLRVCGVEQFAVGHERGSSHGESRVIRMAYFMHPDYVPVLRRAYTLWRDLEAEAGEELMTLPGLLCIGEPGGTFIRGLESCYAAHDLPHERWSAAEAGRRFPQFHLPEDTACYWDPLGGYLRAGAGVRAQAALARRYGAEIVEGETVLGLEANSAGVTVRTAQRTLHAARAVVTVGAFADRFAPGLITPQRKVLFWYRAHDPAVFAGGRFPVWIAKLGGRAYYGFPTLDGATIKCAEDTGGQPQADPVAVEPALLPDDEANLRPFLESLFATQLGARMAHQTCLYENSPDRHFIFDRHPRHENVILALGGSGHGFKFCSVAGEIAADLAQHGHSPLRPEIFTLGDRATGWVSS